MTTLPQIRCLKCHEPLPRDAKPQARYCNERCRRIAQKRRSRDQPIGDPISRETAELLLRELTGAAQVAANRQGAAQRARQSRDGKELAVRRAQSAAAKTERQASAELVAAAEITAGLRRDLAVAREQLLQARQKLLQLSAVQKPTDEALAARLAKVTAAHAQLRQSYDELAEAATSRRERDRRALKALDMLAQVAWHLRKGKPADEREQKLFSSWQQWRAQYTQKKG